MAGAPDPAFAVALEDMGFDLNTRLCFLHHGIHSVSSLIRMLPDELKTWVTDQVKQTLAVPLKVMFPFISLKTLYGFRAWALFRRRAGLPDDVNGFDDNLQEPWDAHCVVITQQSKQTEVQPALEPLTSLNSWPNWEELFITYLGTVRNLKTELSLAYLLRPASEVPP